MSDRPPSSSGAATMLPRRLPTEQVELAARLLLDTLSRESRWQRRLVEEIRFEKTCAKRKLTLDIDPPSSERQVPIPVALFDKDEVVAALSIRDEGQRLLPLLTRSESTTVGYIALRLTIAELGMNVTSEQDALLLDIAARPVEDAQRALEQLRAVAPSWFEDSRVVLMTELLTGHKILFALLASDGRRRIIEASWEENVVGSGGGVRALSMGIAGRGRVLVDSHTLPASRSWHLEITPPYGTKITRASMLGGYKSETSTEMGTQRSASLHILDDFETFASRAALIDLRATASLIVPATAALGLMLLALALAFIFPVTNGKGIVIAGFGVTSIALLLLEFSVVRARGLTFASPLVLGPLLSSLLASLVLGFLIVFGANSLHAISLTTGSAVTGAALLILLRDLVLSERSDDIDVGKAAYATAHNEH